MNKIETLTEACKVLGLDETQVIPLFEGFPEKDREAMQSHAALVLMAKALNTANGGEWIPDWEDYSEYKYFVWFEMGSPSGVGFRFGVAAYWDTDSGVGSRLSFRSRELAEYAGQNWTELYKKYFTL
jgi:hypothetical protein